LSQKRGTYQPFNRDFVFKKLLNPGGSEVFSSSLVFKAHRRVYHSTLGLRVIKKKKSGFQWLSLALDVWPVDVLQGYLVHKKLPLLGPP